MFFLIFCVTTFSITFIVIYNIKKQSDLRHQEHLEFMARIKRGEVTEQEWLERRLKHIREGSYGSSSSSSDWPTYFGD